MSSFRKLRKAVYNMGDVLILITFVLDNAIPRNMEWRWPWCRQLVNFGVKTCWEKSNLYYLHTMVPIKVRAVCAYLNIKGENASQNVILHI